MILRKRIHLEGPFLSRIILGILRAPSWEYSADEMTGYIEAALENGVTTFDNSDIYGDYESQSLFGNVLKKKPSLRDQMQLVSKCGVRKVSDKKPGHRLLHYDTTARHIVDSAEQSLRDLNTDYLDLLLIHRPDPLMNADEISEALSKLVNEGKVLHVGVSNFLPFQFDLLQSRMDIPLVTNQVEASLLHTERIYDGTLDQLQQIRTSPMIWSPLGGGDLFKADEDDKSGEDHEDPVSRVQATLQKMSGKYSCGIDTLALAWLLKLPSQPFPVVGTSNIDHLKNAVEALNIELGRQDWFELLEASRGKPVA